jgi:ElaB/YqjD/DUF883 family membrane-anchored ribosome-binding protein
MAETTAETITDAAKARVGKITEDVQSRLRDASEDVRRGAERASAEIKRGYERASHAAREGYEETARNMREGYTRVRKDFDGLSHDVNEYVRDNPGKSVLMAAGVGFLIGLLFRVGGGRED